MARPIKNEGEKRDQRFNLRMTRIEIETMREEAAKAGLNPHEYARRRALGHRVVSTSFRRSDPALINELNRIGVNLNQLARASNRGRELGEEVEVVIDQLQQALTMVVNHSVAEDS